MDIPVSVYLNESQDHYVFGYQPGDALREAARFAVAPSLLDARDGQYAVLEMVFRELNIDEPAEAWAREYRTRRNRSLSVGDVVQIGECAYAVASCGWDNVALRAEQIRRELAS